MAKQLTVKLAANFERNLADIEQFLTAAHAPQAFDRLLNELLETVIPNLERFPGMGRVFLRKVSGSVEGINALASLREKLASVLAIKHHKQLSFDFEAHWGAR